MKRLLRNLMGCGALALAGSAVLVSMACGQGFVLAADEPESGPDRLCVAAWNVQTLFDGNDDGTEYPDYRASKGWTRTAYRERLERIGAVAEWIAEDGPDILALIEVENGGVIEDLIAGPLKGYGYRQYSLARLPGAALGTAVISKFPIERVRVHTSSRIGAELPRPILEVRVDAGAVLDLLVCHWKSKLGGDEQTEPLRAAAAAVVSRRLEELAKEGASDALVLGDLNENHDEFVRRGSSALTALIRDDPVAAELVNDEGAKSRGFLVLSAARPPVSRTIPRALALFCPWYASVWPGSYVYRGEWETIDHLLGSPGLFDGAGWEWDAFRVVDAPEIVDESGFPRAYEQRTGKGFSDHLPVAVELVRAK